METFLIVAVGFGLVALLCGWAGLDELRRRGRLLRTRPSPIGSCEGGFVALTGRVVPLQTLTSPFAGAPCVLYEHCLEEHVRKGKSASWDTVHDERHFEPFLLDDGTGVARIRADDAELLIRRDVHLRSSSLTADAPELAAYVRACGLPTESFLGLDRRYRLTERFLAPGDEALVLGTARPAEADEGVALVVESGDPDFIVADGGEGAEAAVASTLGSRAVAAFVAATVALGVAAFSGLEAWERAGEAPSPAVRDGKELQDWPGR